MSSNKLTVVVRVSPCTEHSMRPAARIDMAYTSGSVKKTDYKQVKQKARYHLIQDTVWILCKNKAKHVSHK